MPLKDLLVCIDESEPARARLDFAVALARIHAARLTGLFALDLVPTIEGLIRGYGGQHEFLANYAARRGSRPSSPTGCAAKTSPGSGASSRAFPPRPRHFMRATPISPSSDRSTPRNRTPLTRRGC